MNHQFAKVWLNRLGNKIYINNKDFLSHNLDNLKDKVSPLKTFINIGEGLVDEEELTEISRISFPDMKKKFSLSIYRMRAGKKAWRTGQSYIIFIVKKKPGIPDELPESTVRRRGSIIEWDRLRQCIRGVGEDFGTQEGQYKGGDITPWIFYGEKRKRAHNYIFRRDSYSGITDDLYDRWLGKPPSRSQILRIKEIPLMITDEGHLLCLPWSTVLPRILIVGKSGRGKSFTLNSILGRVIYMWQDRAGLLNDSLNQFYDLMLPMEQGKFLKDMLRFGNTGKHLPVINLYMSCPKVKIKYADEQVGYRLVVPFKDFLYRWDYYAQGIKKWEIGGPQKYINKEIVNELDKCKNSNEMRNYLFRKFAETHMDKKGEGIEKGIQQMIMKWVAALDSVLRDEFTSNLFRHEETTAPYWTLKKPKEELTGHPFIISMEAGLLPVINNYLAKNRPIAKKNMANLMRRTIDWQMERDEKKKRIWLFVDELKDFLGKKGDDLYLALDYVFTQGRYNKVGFVGNVQEYTKLTNSMRGNSTHLIIFELQTNEERTAVAKDYRLDREALDSIADLKVFQCLFTTKEKIVLYDKEGKRSEKDGGLYRGKVVPPISVHKSP